MINKTTSKLASNLANKFARLLIISVSCFTLSQAFVQCAQKPLPKVSEVPDNVQAIDAAIERLEKAKQGLEGSKYATDEDAMRLESGHWMDYQEDLQQEGGIDARIQQIQQEIDQLNAKKAALTK